MKDHYRRIGVALGLVWGLGGCAADAPTRPSANTSTLEEIEALALCKQDAQGEMIASKVRAEYGFKRFAENAFRPVLDHKLFGHALRVVEFTDNTNKLYVAGAPSELAYNFKRLLPRLSCEQNSCQAPLAGGQSLLIYKAPIKKIKDTTVIECTRPDEV